MEKNENLPSSTTRTTKPGGERGGGKPTTNDDEKNDIKDAVEELLDDARIKNDEIHDDDLEDVIKLTEKLLKESYSKTKTRQQYTRYQNLWKTFVAKENLTEEYNELMLVKFFYTLKGRYAPSTLWVVFSCVNAYFVDKYGITINGLPRLKKYLKNETSGYVCKKADTFDADQMYSIMTKLQQINTPKSILQAVAITLLYYGLLRSCEVRKIRVKDVKLSERNGKKEILINFPYARKRMNAGMEYNIPSIYFDLYKRYIGELCPKTIAQGKEQFLKNWSTNGKRRIQNTGKGQINLLHKEACRLLGINPSSYSTHTWRRTAATVLADAGVSKTNLKRIGQWKSDTVVEGYIANSVPLRQERLNGLLPPSKREKTNYVRQQNLSEKEDQLVELEDDFVDLNVPGKVTQSKSTELTLYGFSQFDDPDYAIKYLESTDNGVPVMSLTAPNQPNKSIEAEKVITPSAVTINAHDTENKKSPSTKMSDSMQHLIANSGATFNNCTFVFKE